jgi:voltage-gated potassium channel
MTNQIDDLSGHALVCGFGRVGQQLAQELAAYEHPFIIIDTNATRLREAERQGMLVIVGDCTEDSVLLKAGIARASYVASVLSDDAANVFLTLTARELNAQVQIIARAESPATEKKLLRSGANRVVLPTSIGASKIANLITRPNEEELLMEYVGRDMLNEQLDQLGLRLQEFPITKASRLIGQSIGRVETGGGGGYLNRASRHAQLRGLRYSSLRNSLARSRVRVSFQERPNTRTPELSRRHCPIIFATRRLRSQIRKETSYPSDSP